MSSKTLFISVLAICLLAATGIGYAVFSSSIILNGESSAGTLTLEITNLLVQSGPNYVSITDISPPLPSGGNVNFIVGPFAPGDNVVIAYTVLNAGSLPATSLTTVGPSIINKPGCDTIFGISSVGTTPLSLGAGDSFTSTIGIELHSGIGNQFEGCTATVTFSITGSVGS